MAKHIGIVGVSSEGAALCYRTICAESADLMGPHAHPEVSMHTHALSAYVECLDQQDLRGVGDLMASSAQKLVSIGAELLICPDNTVHQAFSHVRGRLTVPWLHIAEVVAAQAQQGGFQCVALTGTRWLVESDVYPEALAAYGVEYKRPRSDEVEEVHRIIMEELVYGITTPKAAVIVEQIIARMKGEGCDAVVLGCTELPLLLNAETSPLPALDSTRLLARAALRSAKGRDRQA